MIEEEAFDIRSHVLLQQSNTCTKLKLTRSLCWVSPPKQTILSSTKTEAVLSSCRGLSRRTWLQVFRTTRKIHEILFLKLRSCKKCANLWKKSKHLRKENHAHLDRNKQFLWYHSSLYHNEWWRYDCNDEATKDVQIQKNALARKILLKKIKINIKLKLERKCNFFWTSVKRRHQEWKKEKTNWSL